MVEPYGSPEYLAAIPIRRLGVQRVDGRVHACFDFAAG